MSRQEKDPARQMAGLLNRAQGKRFEAVLDAAFAYYDAMGLASVDKTPEPMKPIGSVGQGRFIACYERKAQPDYKGVLAGGRELLCEAKYTTTDRLEQSRVKPGQAEYLDKHLRLGAECCVLAGFAGGGVYRVPWGVWRDMKRWYGRKYITEKDLGLFRVETGDNGVLLVLDKTKGERE